MEFEKYLKQGAYHWDATSHCPWRHVAFTAGRYQAILRAVGDWQGKSVLDIACGDCCLSALMASAGATIVGIDASSAGLDVGKKRWLKENPETFTRARFQVADASKELPFDTGSFDIVIASEIIEHLEEPQFLISEMARVAAPDGLVVITTPYRLTEKPLDPFHVHEFYPGELEEMTRKFFDKAEIILTHPAWVTGLFKLRHPFRLFRGIINLMSMFGYNPFLEWPTNDYPSQITMIARKTGNNNL